MEPFRRFEMHNGRRKAKPVDHAPEHLDIFPQLQQVIDDELSTRRKSVLFDE